MHDDDARANATWLMHDYASCDDLNVNVPVKGKGKVRIVKCFCSRDFCLVKRSRDVLPAWFPNTWFELNDYRYTAWYALSSLKAMERNFPSNLPQSVGSSPKIALEGILETTYHDVILRWLVPTWAFGRRAPDWLVFRDGYLPLNEYGPKMIYS